MRRLQFILVGFALVVFSHSAGANVWEALADTTQLFSASCPSTPSESQPGATEGETEAGFNGVCPACEYRRSPPQALLEHARLVSDDTYLGALANERALNHECAIAQLEQATKKEFPRYAADIESKVQALTQVIADRVRSIESNERLSPQQLSANREAVGKKNKEFSAASEAIFSSIPFSSHPEMQELVSRHSRGSTGARENFRQELLKTLNKIQAHLKKDVKNLKAGVESGGSSLDRVTRESLAQDRDLIESFVSRNPSLKGPLKAVACRVDRTYGSGAESRDQALFVGSFAVGGGAALLKAGAKGISLLAATSSARLASARGILTANSARVLGTLAVHSGRTALAIGTAAGFRETANACLNSQQVVPKSNLAEAARCENYSVKGIVADNCFLAAGLTTIGTVANIPAVQRLAGRLLGRASSPATRAEETVGRSLTPEQQAAVQAAHEVGLGAPGRNGQLAGVGNYTDAQLREKAEILKRAGFTEAERRKLIEAGVVGFRPNELPPGFNSPYVSFKATDGQRYVGRILGGDDAGYLLEVEGGIRHRISPAQLETFKESSAAKLALERTSDYGTNRFRDSFVQGNFTEDRGFIAFLSGGERFRARAVGVKNGQWQFEIVDPKTGKREVRALTKEELLTAGESASARNLFAELDQPPAPGNTRPTAVILKDFSAQQGQALDENVRLISGRKYLAEDGTSVTFNTATPPSARDFALQEGRLFEIRASQPRQLPEGQYTYTITRDGVLTVGRVEDSFEYGVKHSALARGREVVSAGELRVGANGAFTFNDSSGTFVRPLVEEAGVNPQQLAERTARSLERYFGTSGRRTSASLLPKETPSRERLRQLCNEVPFCNANAKPCQTLFGAAVCP